MAERGPGGEEAAGTSVPSERETRKGRRLLAQKVEENARIRLDPKALSINVSINWSTRLRRDRHWRPR